ncbi:MAG: hypothetical protein LW854_21010 [Rubrivivax sp.]|jgi:hypothetical protein|nr:hypothetical protein [Rubrivivax sp.]
MFGTPWPPIAEALFLGADAIHAFDVLHRLHGDTAAARRWASGLRAASEMIG